MPNENKISVDAPRKIREEIKVSSPKSILLSFLIHLMTFLGGALSAGLWLVFIFFRRFEIEWGKDCFRAPHMLFVTTGFFFLMGMGLVYGIRHIIIWLRECRTYE